MINFKKDLAAPEKVVRAQEKYIADLNKYWETINTVMSKVVYIVTTYNSDTYSFFLGIATAISINLFTNAIPNIQELSTALDIFMKMSTFLTLLIFNIAFIAFSHLTMSIRRTVSDFMLSNHSDLTNRILYKRAEYTQLFYECYKKRKELQLCYMLSSIFGVLSIALILFDMIV